MLLPKTYTPEQIAQILQLSKNTIYELISRGEIKAKKLGKVYRIPQSSISFVFDGLLDQDIQQMQKVDEKTLKIYQKSLTSTRKKLWQKSRSS